MFKRILPLAAGLLLYAASGASAQQLGIGSPAPKLQVKEFVKGQPVTAFQKGKTYVVEFWATWCGPCRTTIPHLTELQKKYPQVTFLGISVWERDASAVKPFVQQMGDKMAYRVALDAVPANGEADEGFMAKNWMSAAGQNGIPAAFIVNGEGKIAWIGHPMAMDKPLEQIVAGKFDLQAALAEQRKEQAQAQKLNALRAKLGAAQQSGDPKQVVAVVDEAIAADPELEEPLAFLKFRSLAGPKGDPAKAVEYGRQLLKGVYKSNAQALNAVAWSLVEPGGAAPSADAKALALEAALQADTLSQQKDFGIADTLARAYFVSGNAAKALETQERAMTLAKGTPAVNDPELKQRLEEYRKAAGK